MINVLGIKNLIKVLSIEKLWSKYKKCNQVNVINHVTKVLWYEKYNQDIRHKKYYLSVNNVIKILRWKHMI